MATPIETTIERAYNLHWGNVMKGCKKTYKTVFTAALLVLLILGLGGPSSGSSIPKFVYVGNSGAGTVGNSASGTISAVRPSPRGYTRGEWR
jgi:hypothetical protein